MEITKRILQLQDEKYADFQSKLLPGISRESIIGVRVPQLRKIAVQYKKEEEASEFLRSLPHRYYDENMLHALLVSECREYETCVQAVDRFLPYINNWAVCDILSPKVFQKNKKELIRKIREWILSEHIYTCRFGMGMLMRHYLDEDFEEEYLEWPCEVRLKEYYVGMMEAWFFATALAKQWKAAVAYLEQDRLDPWVHNKTIQKARESYRITPEQKAYLKELKRK